MYKKLSFMVLCLAFLTVSSLAYAEKVQVTQNGKKYHKADCRTIKNRDVTTMEESEAMAQGYEPCGRCFNDKLTQGDDGSKETKTTKAVKTTKNDQSKQKSK